MLLFIACHSMRQLLINQWIMAMEWMCIYTLGEHSTNEYVSGLLRIWPLSCVNSLEGDKYKAAVHLVLPVQERGHSSDCGTETAAVCACPKSRE